MGLHQYWAQVFVLPKSVQGNIAKVCRAFLWSGDFQTMKPGYVAWNDVCKPKKVGGIGIRDVHAWNVAMMGKRVWAITTKEDNLWIKWVHAIYNKDAN